MAESPDQLPWSSHAFNAFNRSDALLTPHPCYLGLGNTPEQRATAYRALVCEALPQSRIEEIRLYLQQQRALGRDAFREMIENKTRRFAGIRAAPPAT